MDSKKTSDFDQLAAMVGDVFPGLWFRLYSNLIASGFDEAKAFELLKVYVHGVAGGKADLKV
jgi:hypothetical protein